MYHFPHSWINTLIKNFLFYGQFNFYYILIFIPNTFFKMFEVLEKMNKINSYKG